ncbi:hypothetical protein CBR_g54952 [Chara braunii]|uniref:Cation-transporting P-type ATPase C-terminal domain-containing protein n=1 Tax=Chara braunii TaxID=69332 RepID=A0A388K7Q2_CHABU|nr:hypothetical protein CBR_g54952 [Chara braunii]|eukprot:GBG65973.1 hypothetical protein CBR_g54952 [Chara braunii]
MCQNYFDADAGKTMSLSKQKTTELLEIIERMATQSLRTLVLAYTHVTSNAPLTQVRAEDWNVPTEELTCLAILGIKDPPRPGVEQAVKLCQKAGVRVRMVTGDNAITAKAIATECGIYNEGGAWKVVEGSTFRRLSPEEKREQVNHIAVMARSSPTDKLELVKALRENGEVVAVTGDGTNDAPALHEADIGLAMGIAGTEVAKESADIVILDDNFASIVKVVRWGRSVFANIQKFIQFQLTINIAALSINFISVCEGSPIPLTTVQMFRRTNSAQIS